MVSFVDDKREDLAEKINFLSNCCNASVVDESDVCSKCKEHCEDLE
jgi:hypothetical protein